MYSTLSAWLALGVGLLSALDWLRASNEPVTDAARRQSAVPDLSMPPAPYNPKQVSVGGISDAVSESSKLNKRAAQWATGGVILSAASQLLAKYQL